MPSLEDGLKTSFKEVPLLTVLVIAISLDNKYIMSVLSIIVSLL
jgi:hypothetical protein